MKKEQTGMLNVNAKSIRQVWGAGKEFLYKFDNTTYHESHSLVRFYEPSRLT